MYVRDMAARFSMELHAIGGHDGQMAHRSAEGSDPQTKFGISVNNMILCRGNSGNMYNGHRLCLSAKLTPIIPREERIFAIYGYYCLVQQSSDLCLEMVVDKSWLLESFQVNWRLMTLST